MVGCPMPPDCEFVEQAIVYSVEGDSCLAIHHAGKFHVTTGVVLVVGGRQYRAGAHRQFVLLARALASAGFHVLRFDIRGMGDSAGDIRSYADTQEDICSAVHLLKQQAPKIERVVLWGLCDGATAAMLNVDRLPEVHGVVLVNPWVTTEVGFAKAQMKHYYQKRFLHADFWKKMLSGKLDFKASISSLVKTCLLAFNLSKPDEEVIDELPKSVFESLAAFKGLVCVVVSQSDLTAMEFSEAFDTWRASKNTMLSNLSTRYVDADHTFSSKAQHEKLIAITLEFVSACDQAQG